MTDVMIETIAGTNLDVTIYRGKGDEIFLEGVADIRGVTPGPNPPLDWFKAWNFPVSRGVVPFGRIINNTLVGDGGRLTAFEERDDSLTPRGGVKDVGILVEDNASPTILNNILVNFGTGVAADNSSQDTVLGANLYQGNFNDLRNVTIGDFAIQLADDEPLFVDFENDNYYLATGARAIDSSVDSLEERPELAIVKQPVGIALSPIAAPDRDGIGQLRADDPTVEPPEGFGQNVFKDRGAIDRVDFAGPIAILIDPRDNDAAGNDRDPAPSIVQLGNQTLRVFSVQIQDGTDDSAQAEGTGVDRITLSGAAVAIVQVNNDTGATRTLQENIDYTFSFDTTNSIIRLTPLAGVWASKHTYTITLDNSATTGIQDIAGNALRPNQLTG
jgi:hypothetical protein